MIYKSEISGLPAHDSTKFTAQVIFKNVTEELLLYIKPFTDSDSVYLKAG